MPPSSACTTATGPRPREWVDGHARLVERFGQEEAFVAFTVGELAADVAPAAALAWYEEAERHCDEHGHAYVLHVSRIGRLALPTRTGRPLDAAACALGLLDDLRRLGMWPQLWTTVRLTAELLVALGDLASAAHLLAAAGAIPWPRRWRSRNRPATRSCGVASARGSAPASWPPPPRRRSPARRGRGRRWPAPVPPSPPPPRAEQAAGKGRAAAGQAPSVSLPA